MPQDASPRRQSHTFDRHTPRYHPGDRLGEVMPDGPRVTRMVFETAHHDTTETHNQNGAPMTDVAAAEANTALDQLGPVDFVIVEFPADASNFTGEIAKELLALVDAGTIRVIDVLIITKDADGNLDATELSDLEDLGELEVLEAQLAELLAEEDVAHLAAAMDPGSTAGVLIYENLWAAPFASAVRRAGGQLIADGRIPIQAIIAAIEADDDLDETTGD